VPKVARLTPEARVQVAFLERMEPDLAVAIAQLVDAGCLCVHVVPVFLGEGGHVREDVPKLISAARERYPHITIELGRAAGEDESVLDAIAAYCART
jgi:sirohydrochlorin cobaltochelatase